MSVSVCIDMGTTGIAYFKMKSNTDTLEVKSPVATTTIIGNKKKPTTLHIV
jgi:hypothetical protein